MIKDENQIREFIKVILLPLKDDEVYIVVLNARKKYCPTIASSMEVVARDIIKNNDTEKILRKLKKMSTVEGLYTDKNGDIIPNESFALYILPEPRSMLKAYKEFTNNINEWIYADLFGTKNLELYRKLNTKLFSAIHKSTSRRNYFIIDIDRKDEQLLNDVIMRLGNGDLIEWISETRGGYHILVNRLGGELVHKLSISLMPDVEFRKETMTPIPGTLQGGFEVKCKYRKT